eukprot:6213566-Pleurochrysis_carterae.AAC.1
MRALVRFRLPSRSRATSCSVTAARASWLHAQSRMSRKRAPTPRALPSHAAGQAVYRLPPFACHTARML